ncbi:hypothetical protein CDL15_Pgr028222 [Punica granatum]|uniref:Uncharacterized protein n=1 Tax=Punica granatum TaxID=22663 RepID=A0A218WWH4_PUNGR|nr:hypothetical protein CDL15_Pgr028222 [Punica granatum]PKI31693.1 hypothetical protein CRG98_047903 [Punica granatum]
MDLKGSMTDQIHAGIHDGGLRRVARREVRGRRAEEINRREVRRGLRTMSKDRHIVVSRDRHEEIGRNCREIDRRE